MAEISVVDEINVIFNADISRFTSGLSQVSSNLSNMNTSFGSLANAGSKLLAAIGLGQVVNDMKNFAEESVSAYANLQQITTAFDTLTGSSSKANALLEQINSIPWAISITQVESMAQKLIGIGVNSDEVIPLLQGVNDAASALHLGASGADSIVTALGRIQATGEVTAMSFRPLISQGINAWKLLADYLGVSVTQAEELVKKHGVSAAQGMAALAQGLTATYGSAAKENLTSINGLFTRSSNDITAIMQVLGKNIVDAFNFSGAQMNIVNFLDNLNELSRHTGSVAEALKKLIPPGLQIAIAALAGAIGGLLVMALISAITFFSGLVIAAAPFIAIGAAIGAVALVIGEHWKTLAPYVIAFAGAITAYLIPAIGAALVSFGETVAIMALYAAEAIVAAAATLIAAAPWIILGAIVALAAYEIITHIHEISTGIQNDAKIFEKQLSEIGQFFTKIVDGIKNDAKVFAKQLSDLWSSIYSQASSTWNSITSYISDKATSIWNTVVSMATNIYNSISNWIGKIPSLFIDAFNSVVSFVTGLPGKLGSIAANVGSAIVSGFNAAIGKHSPSYIEQAFMDIGNQASRTLVDLKKMAPGFADVASTMTVKLPSIMPSGTMGIMAKNQISGLPSSIAPVFPTIPPTGISSLSSIGSTPQATSPVPANATQSGAAGGGIQVGQLVVREEADLQKIARLLFRMQQNQLRPRGFTP